MALIHLPAAQHAKVPWKNGLGVSRIIASEPPAAGYDAVLWQVGSTEITADCPFSSLPGLDRLFMVIEGAGVELRSVDDHGAVRTTPVRALHPPYVFRGDWKTGCRLLGGPVRVFNVIARRGKVAATVSLERQREVAGAAGGTAIAVDLASLDAWRLEGAGSMDLPPGPLAVVRIHPA